MATILVLQHSSYGPGRLGMTLRDHGFHLDTRRVDRHSDQSPTLPSDLDNIHGLVILGGPQSVAAPEPWMDPEMALIRAAHEAQLPVIGICLGHQLIAQALGGTVAPMDKPELGFPEIEVLVPGQTHAILAGVPWQTRLCQDHAQQVTELPEGATLLMSSPACKVQAFAAGLRTFGFQFHFEATRAMIATMHTESSKSLKALGMTLDDLGTQVTEHYDRFAVVADRLCLNLLTNAFPIAGLLAV